MKSNRFTLNLDDTVSYHFKNKPILTNQYQFDPEELCECPFKALLNSMLIRAQHNH